MERKRLDSNGLRSIVGAFWRALGSSHLRNMLALLTLIVTVYLTVYIFEYTKRQEESRVEVVFHVVPTASTAEGREWDVNISLHNSGPADISVSSLFIEVEQIPSIKLIGFEAKSFVSTVREPRPRIPPPTPWPSDFGDYLVPLENFERGDNLMIHMVFLVESDLSETLEAKWNALGLQKVVDPQTGGHYYDKSQVDSDAYAELVNTFIRNISLTGQNVHLIRRLD